MGITIDEIAKLAGVSKTTVSRVLNNKPDVKPETREIIMSLISKYDFQPNAFAKAISLKKSQTIGLIIPYEADYIFSNPFYAEVMRGISTEIDKHGYYLLLCYTHEDNYIDIYKQKRVDGYILMSPGRYHKDIVKLLKEVNAPFVATAKVPGERNVLYVDVNNYLGAVLAVEYLISLGHKRIGFIINGPQILASSQERLKGYRTILSKHGIEYDKEIVKIGDTSVKSGYTAMKQLLELGDSLTAVFVANDMMAIGAIKAIKEEGKNIPNDISVIGFDDIPLAEVIDPPLTTVRQPAFEKGEKAAKLLIKMIEQKEKIKSEVLRVELIVRNSTGYAKR